jgi:hypothetical protein
LVLLFIKSERKMENKYISICSFCERGFCIDMLSKKISYTKSKPKNVEKRKLKCCFPCFTKPQNIKSQCPRCKLVTTIPGEV